MFPIAISPIITSTRSKPITINPTIMSTVPDPGTIYPICDGPGRCGGIAIAGGEGRTFTRYCADASKEINVMTVIEKAISFTYCFILYDYIEALIKSLFNSLINTISILVNRKSPLKRAFPKY